MRPNVPIVQAFWVTGDECFREDDHPCAGRCSVAGQRGCLVNAALSIEWNRARLDYSNAYSCLASADGHLVSFCLMLSILSGFVTPNK